MQALPRKENLGPSRGSAQAGDRRCVSTLCLYEQGAWWMHPRLGKPPLNVWVCHQMSAARPPPRTPAENCFAENLQGSFLEFEPGLLTWACDSLLCSELQHFGLFGLTVCPFMIESHPCLPGSEREIWMEISFLNINVSNKRETSLFSEPLLCLLFLKNKRLKVILMPKSHILEWHILLPFTVSQERRKWESWLTEFQVVIGWIWLLLWMAIGASLYIQTYFFQEI